MVLKPHGWAVKGAAGPPSRPILAAQDNLETAARFRIAQAGFAPGENADTGMTVVEHGMRETIGFRFLETPIGCSPDNPVSYPHPQISERTP
jgi:hypothetical protein